MNYKLNKAHIGVILTVTFLCLSIIANVWEPNTALAGEAFQSPVEFEKEFGYYELVTWGNFSATPTENPPPTMMKAQMGLTAWYYMLDRADFNLRTAGRATETLIDYDTGHILAKFSVGTRVIERRQINAYGQIKGQTFMMVPVDDEGGWSLSNPQINLVRGDEQELAEKGIGEAFEVGSGSITTLGYHDNATGFATNTIPTTNNYTLDTGEAYVGYAFEAGGDLSIDDIGEDIAQASNVEWYNTVNSTAQCVVLADGGMDAVGYIFATWDNATGVTAFSKSLGYIGGSSVLSRIITQFKTSASTIASRLGGSTKRIATAVRSVPTFIGSIGSKAKTAAVTVVNTGKTVLNKLKTGIMMVPKLIAGLSKWILIPAIIILLLIVFVVLKKWTGVI